MDSLLILGVASGAANLILKSSQDVATLSKIFDGTKQQSALDKAHRHHDIVKDLSIQAVDGPIPNEGEVPRYLPKLAYEERVHAWKEYQESFVELVRIIKPVSKSRTKRLLRTYIVATQWHRVQELVKSMDKNKKTLENAVQSDLNWLQLEHNRVIQRYLIAMAQAAPKPASFIPPSDRDIEDWKRPEPQKPISKVMPEGYLEKQTSLNETRTQSSEFYHVVEHHTAEITPSPNFIPTCVENEPGDLIPGDASVTPSAANISAPQYEEAAPTDIANKIFSTLASTTKEAASTAAAAVSPEIVTAGLIGTLALGASTLLLKGCDTHIGYRNASTARQVAMTGDRNADTANLVAVSGLQTSLAARDSANAAVLTAKVTDEKWKHEQQKDTINSKLNCQSCTSKSDARIKAGEAKEPKGEINAIRFNRTAPSAAMARNVDRPVETAESSHHLESPPNFRQSFHNGPSISQRRKSQTDPKSVDRVRNISQRKKAKSNPTFLGPNTKKYNKNLAIQKARDKQLNENLGKLRAESNETSPPPTRPKKPSSPGLRTNLNSAKVHPNRSNVEVAAIAGRENHNQDLASEESDWAGTMNEDTLASATFPMISLQVSTKYPSANSLPPINIDDDNDGTAGVDFKDECHLDDPGLETDKSDDQFFSDDDTDNGAKKDDDV